MLRGGGFPLLLDPGPSHFCSICCRRDHNRVGCSATTRADGAPLAFPRGQQTRSAHRAVRLSAALQDCNDEMARKLKATEIDIAKGGGIGTGGTSCATATSSTSPEPPQPDTTDNAVGFKTDDAPATARTRGPTQTTARPPRAATLI